jgi:glycerophosphoryl diester phosphodiesterase
VISLARRDGRPLRIGHRGAAALAPENTLRSLRAARAAGVDLIEFDVLALDGGELVLAHSNDLSEVSGGVANGSVRERSLAGLREIVPDLASLEQALEFFVVEAGDVGVHLDLKSVGVEHAVADALARFGLLGRTVVSSFRPSVVRRVSELEPRVRTCISFPEDRLRISDLPGSSPLVRVGLRCARPMGPAVVGRLLARSRATVVALHHALVSAAAVNRAHRRGAAVLAWTIENPGDLERVDLAGVDAVVVNDPGMFELRSG